MIHLGYLFNLLTKHLVSTYYIQSIVQVSKECLDQQTQLLPSRGYANLTRALDCRTSQSLYYININHDSH